MRKETIKILALGVMMSLGFGTFAQNKTQKSGTEMFPKAKEGIQKLAIEVPKAKNENDLKIEFYVGKNEQTDACNNFFLTGKIEKKDLSGWGYNYYEFVGKGDVVGTLMACPDKNKITRFVSSQSVLVNYNSKLPIVIYAPEGFEVRYKVWRADKQIRRAVSTQ